MEIYILFFGELYCNSGVIQIKAVIICIFFNSLIFPTAYNLMLATLINFSHSSRNPNKEDKKPNEFLYLLNPDDKL